MVEAITSASSDARFLTRRGIRYVYHCAPLHYILFIARSRCLLSKSELRRAGFDYLHFRSTSRGPDERRGFADYVHLSIVEDADILLAKLARGFPHFALVISAAAVEHQRPHLCCYNIAKTRNLRSGKRPSPESELTGYFHGSKEVPTAETVSQCESLLASNGAPAIEVLVARKLPLATDTELIFFDDADLQLATRVLKPLTLTWRLSRRAVSSYPRAARYASQVERYLERAAADQNWRGDGLGFDFV